MELKFIDFEAARAFIRLMNEDIEENFDDMRVGSVVEESESALKVENHV